MRHASGADRETTLALIALTATVSAGLIALGSIRPSDVIVGGLAGIALAAGCALAYEAAVRHSVDPYPAD